MDLPHPKFRCRAYFIAQRVTDCRVCGSATRIAALGMPVDHQVLDHDEDTDVSAWQPVAGRALLFHVGELPPHIKNRLSALAPGFRRMQAEPDRNPYWVNHCERCNAVLDDQELHCEPGNTFVPNSEADGSQIRLTEIHEPFQASAGGYSIEPQFLPFAR